MTSVSSEVLKCAELPEHLRSEISFLRTCNIPNLISHSSVETFHWFLCLHGCEIACALNQTFAQCKIFLQGTLLATNFTNFCKHIDKWNKREVWGNNSLSIWDIAIHLEELHKICRRSAIRSPLVWTYVPYRYEQSLSRCITCQDVCVQQLHAAKRIPP